jgi:capsular polysaccharide biosynthesis protein
MTKASKQKFKDAKKKLKANLITSIGGILNKADATIHEKIKKSVENAASKIAKEFTKQAKKHIGKVIKANKTEVVPTKKKTTKKPSRPATRRKPASKQKANTEA